eukprot:Ihof_evm1s838 gene=Ihof_evmTU1s838
MGKLADMKNPTITEESDDTTVASSHTNLLYPPATGYMSPTGSTDELKTAVDRALTLNNDVNHRNVVPVTTNSSSDTVIKGTSVNTSGAVGGFDDKKDSHDVTDRAYGHMPAASPNDIHGGFAWGSTLNSNQPSISRSHCEGHSYTVEVDRNGESDEEEEEVKVERRSGAKRWFKRFIIAFVISAIAMLPGVLTRIYAPEYTVFGWPFISWAAYVSCAAWVYIPCRMCVALIHIIVLRVYVGDVSLVFLLKDLKGVTAYTLWAVFNLVIWLLVPWVLFGDPNIVYVIEPNLRLNLSLFCIWLIFLGCVNIVKVYYLKKAAFKFHKKVYFQRIQEALFAESILNKLLKHKSRKVDHGIDNQNLEKVTKSNLTEESLNSLIKRTGKPTMLTSITNSQKSKEVARQLWTNVRMKGEEEITLKDFKVFIHGDDALKAFALFDNDGSGGISQGEVKDAVRTIMKERRNLQLSLKDAKSIVSKLTSVFNFMATAIAILVLFMVLNQIFKDVVLPMVTSLLGFSFVISSTAAKLMESIIFILVMHPYDVGDRVFIDEDNLVVKKISFQETIFTQADGKELYIANWILYGKKIYNIRRSGPCTQEVLLDTWYGVSNEMINQFTERLQVFIKENSVDYANGTVAMTQTYQGRKCQLSIWVQHRDNFQDGTVRWRRWNKLCIFCKGTADELDITYKEPKQ